MTPTFKNFRLMQDVNRDEQYFSGLAGKPFEGYVVGKLRPWDKGCDEYVLYCDGDLMIAEIVK